jgi:predicted MFS family arabinose efflux permease
VSRRSEFGATLARLTAVKAVANTALRWIPPFLPTLERAFGATTSQLTTAIGVGELAGLSTVAVGAQLDRGRERAVLVASMLLVAASSLIALIGTIAAFAVAFFVLVLGVSNFTVAGQAWISHRVGYERRARALGLFETSWAVALLVGAPVVAVLINVLGWRGPFVVLAIASAAGAALVAVTLPGTPDVDLVPVPAGTKAAPEPARARITLRAWLVMIASATTAMAGLSIFVISGTWLDDAFGVSTGGVGVVAMAFGGVELVASLTSAGVADRVGKVRSTMAGLAVLLLGLAVMAAAGGAIAVGVPGLLAFLIGFEFAFVTSLSLVSEAMPDARGSTLAVSNAVGTIARAIAAIAGGWLYGRYGIDGTAALAGAAAVTAVTCLLVSRRLPRPVPATARS